MTGLMDSPPHVEVAAYILGVLNKEDSEAFDRHLLDCPSCQDELRDMYELPDALDVIKRGMKGTVNGAARGTVNGTGAGYRANGAVPAAVNGASHNGNAPFPDGVIRDLWSPQPRRRSAPAHRHAASEPSDGRSRDDLAESRARRRRALLLGVAAALVVGVTGAATSQLLWPHANSAPVAAATPGGSVAGEIKEGTSPDTGVSGSVGLVAKGWGTEVAFQLAGVRGPERCSLIAVSRSGDTDVVSGWRIPPGEGYGVSGHPDPLRLTGGTALAKSDIVRFEVRRDDGVRLLEIPVA
ncbi:anti-sigma factor family protein [Sphaerisporangium perillae]|uniref:anti-sigma factor family protein n=1 Tax=Sphaerisporangium perillae TaxID=2935860 RepID=UPI00200DE8E6|nr:zf-HC2 domain-containing protein [Sphaerisporangium perillae]